MRLLRDEVINAERAKLLDVRVNTPLPREAYQVRVSLDPAERDALCHLGETLVSERSRDHALLWRILALLTWDTAQDRSRDLAIRCLQLPCPKEIVCDQHSTIRAAITILIANESQRATDILTECALLPLHGSPSRLFPPEEGGKLPEGFTERTACSVLGLFVGAAAKARVVPFMEGVLHEYESSGRFAEDSLIMQQVRHCAEVARKVAADVPNPAGLPPPVPPPPAESERPPPGVILWMDAGSIPPRLSTALLMQELPNLIDSEGYAKLVGDGTGPEPNWVAIRREALDLFHVSLLDGYSPEEAVQACEDLIRYEPLPEEVRRWAHLRRLLLLDQLGQIDQLMRLGEAWIAQHPDDEIDVGVRWFLAERYVHQHEETLGVPMEERQAIVDRLITPVFQRRSPYDRATISLYLAYAQAIDVIGTHVTGKRSRGADAAVRAGSLSHKEWEAHRRELAQFGGAFRQRSRDYLMEVISILEQYLANPNLADRWHLTVREGQEALALAKGRLKGLDDHIASRRGQVYPELQAIENQLDEATEAAFREALADEGS
ncbi:MAG: hypothetical protein JXR94_00660 [Candidatus Hydrogenedentes bacterium]|nr:hypothetical protein [Candidatus Hydrogenedentota bacterium]